VLCMGRAPSGQGPGLVLRTLVGAANSDAYLTRLSGDRLETQLYMRILGGRYWDRTNDPCRVKVSQSSLAALVTARFR